LSGESKAAEMVPAAGPTYSDAKAEPLAEPATSIASTRSSLVIAA
jgi:hypothetical protein